MSYARGGTAAPYRASGLVQWPDSEAPTVAGRSAYWSRSAVPTRSAARLILTQGCRLAHCSKVGSYVGYSGRDAGIVVAAALTQAVW